MDASFDSRAALFDRARSARRYFFEFSLSNQLANSATPAAALMIMIRPERAVPFDRGGVTIRLRHMYMFCSSHVASAFNVFTLKEIRSTRAAAADSRGLSKSRSAARAARGG